MKSGQHGKSYFWGIFFIALGALLFLDNWHFIDFDFVIENFWPLILIAIGLRFLFKHRNQKMPHYHSEPETTTKPVSEKKRNSESQSQDSNVFGDIRLRFDNREIIDYACHNVFGDISLDFSRANLQNNSDIRVNGVFGDLEIVLPAEINPDIRANVTFGSMQVLGERRDGVFNQLHFIPPDIDAELPSVRINVSQVFGDIQVYYQT